MENVLIKTQEVLPAERTTNKSVALLLQQSDFLLLLRHNFCPQTSLWVSTATNLDENEGYILASSCSQAEITAIGVAFHWISGFWFQHGSGRNDVRVTK